MARVCGSVLRGPLAQKRLSQRLVTVLVDWLKKPDKLKLLER